jgi:NAD(P)-dependent dehydrogenase (short-subunit alcohol dehydrogenase family)
VPGILGHTVSSASKETFWRALASELAPRNIRVVCIRSHALTDAPAAGSYTQKLFTPAATAAGLSVDEWVAGLAEGTMLKRLPRLSHVAETAAFLAWDRARVMTGTVANLTSGAVAD